MLIIVHFYLKYDHDKDATQWNDLVQDAVIFVYCSTHAVSKNNTVSWNDKFAGIESKVYNLNIIRTRRVLLPAGTSRTVLFAWYPEHSSLFPRAFPLE